MTIASVRLREIPGLRRYFAAYTADTSADLLWYVILAWVAGGSGAAAGLILCAGIIPAIVLAPLGGALVDRLGVVRAVRYTLTARIVTMLAWAIAFLAGADLSAWLAAVSAFTIGVVDGLHQPTLEIWPIAVTQGAPEGVQTRLYATERIILRVAQAVAGVAGGALLTRWGEGVPAVVAAILFLLALLTFARIPVSQLADEPVEREDREGLIQGARAGFRAALSDPVLSRTIPIHGLYNASTAGVMLAAIPIRAREQGWPALWFGTSFGAWGIGLLLGTLAMLRAASRVPTKVFAGLLCAGLTGALLGGSAFVDSPWVVTVLVGLAGVCSGPVGPCLGGYLREQIRIRPDRGAIAGVQALSLGGLEPVGYLGVGLVAGFVGAGWGVAIAGLTMVVVATYGLASGSARSAIS